MKHMKNKLFNNKKAEADWLTIILVLLVIAIGGYVLMKSRMSFADSAKKYSSDEFGDFGDADNDGIINMNDLCPAKACDPRLAQQAGSMDKNPSSERYGCLETQTACGTTMECRQAAAC